MSTNGILLTGIWFPKQMGRWSSSLGVRRFRNKYTRLTDQRSSNLSGPLRCSRVVSCRTKQRWCLTGIGTRFLWLPAVYTMDCRWKWPWYRSRLWCWKVGGKPLRSNLRCNNCSPPNQPWWGSTAWKETHESNDIESPRNLFIYLFIHSFAIGTIIIIYKQLRW